jgi:hypothetical protein
MEDNPDMTVEGEKALSNYQTNATNLVDLQDNFETLISKMKDFKSSILRNEQEMGDIMGDMKQINGI